ncbi:hypothetical protein NC652_025303 [Populus alba x Populus x berolinensis]|nr:hypothetical protein NC652_025303 [Populus alba x Populus x berolinensis]
MSPLLCYLCYRDQETVSHLLIHRRKVWILWSRQWSFYAHGERQRRIWSLILDAMPWSVWLARNNCIFDDFVLDSDRIYALVFHSVAFWA